MPWVSSLSLRCPRRAPVVVVTRSGESDSVVVRTPPGINRHMELKRTVELTPTSCLTGARGSPDGPYLNANLLFEKSGRATGDTLHLRLAAAAPTLRPFNAVSGGIRQVPGVSGASDSKRV